MSPKMEAGGVMSAESGMGWISRDNIARSSLRVVAHGTIQPHTKDDCYRPSPVYRRELAAAHVTRNTPRTPPAAAREDKSPISRHPPAPSRRRSALKPATPRVDLISPTPAKQSPGSISMVAHSSSVVAPSRDGKAGMLFSRGDLRVSRTGPLSVSASDGHACAGSANGRRACSSLSGGNQSKGCSSVCTLPRQSPTFAGVRAEEAHRRAWCFAGPSCSSPPRLAALGTTPRTGRRATTGGRLETRVCNAIGPRPCGVANNVVRRSSAGAPVVAPVCSVIEGKASPAAETGGSEKARGTAARSFPRMPPLKKMASEERDSSTVTGATGKGTAGVLKRPSEGCAEADVSSRVKAQRSKPGSCKQSVGGGAHTGMSVAEFADKVAALAADVASVLGISGKRASTSPTVNCKTQEGRMRGRTSSGVGL